MKLSLTLIFKSSWLPHSTYMYLDFHLLCSITKPKEHRREIFYSKSPRSLSRLPRFNWNSWTLTSEDSNSLTSAKATLTKIQGEQWTSWLLSISWITQTNRVQDIKAHTDQVPPSTNQYDPILTQYRRYRHLLIYWPSTFKNKPVSLHISTCRNTKLIFSFIYYAWLKIITLLCIYGGMPLQILHQTNASEIKILLPAESGTWSCLFQSWRWQVSQWWQ